MQWSIAEDFEFDPELGACFDGEVEPLVRKLSAKGDIMIAAFTGRSESLDIDRRVKYGTRTIIVLLDTLLGLCGICNEQVNLLSGCVIQFALLRNHKGHERAYEGIEFTVAWVFAVKIIVTPVVSCGRVAIANDELVRASFGDLVCMKI